MGPQLGSGCSHRPGKTASCGIFRHWFVLRNIVNLKEIFRADGALARALTGYRPRASQLRIAERIAEALQLRESLLIEAGTGTGKTFAYLVPALTSGLRVLISTGTRTLQDQLFNRDLPLLAAAIGRPVKVALLKGRANYLCRTRATLPAQSALLPAADQPLLARVADWAGRTRTGDLAEVPELGESHPLRTQLTSTRDNCLANRCAEFTRCHVFAARRTAMEADLVIVNHHLLMADLALKEDGFGDLLPSVDALILDEAHQLPELAAEFFGLQCSSRQLESLLQDTRRLFGSHAVPAPRAMQLRQPLDAALTALLSMLAGVERRIAWQDLAVEAQQRFNDARLGCLVLAEGIDALQPDAELQQCAARAREISATLKQIIDGEVEGARSVQLQSRSLTLSLLPYDVSTRFRGLLQQRRCAWIFTSATLALAGDFTHFAGRLGLDDLPTLCVDSPFDYENQALLYLPAGMPDPASPSYTDAVLNLALPLLAASAGGAFLLFTSHRALNAAARVLRGRPDGPALLVQGEAPREQLLRRFRSSGRAVLLGTASFWEGVDVQGPALRLVIIDKLPFAHIDDPQVRARVEHLNAQGGNPFRDYQLPEAALALKQGVGRLIRSEDDRGVVAICDPRLTGRGYGRVLRAALPPMRITQSMDDAIDLLRDCARELPTAPATAGAAS